MSLEQHIEFRVGKELAGATDDEIDAAVTDADPMVLRGCVFQLTGDPALEATAVTEQASIDPAVMTDDESIAVVRAKAADLLRRLRDAGTGPVDAGPRDRLARSMALAAGVDEVPADDLALWLEELALDPYARGHEWEDGPTDEQREAFPVVVVGAGMGGLNAAIQLRHAGLDVTVLEKNPGVGGTWYENRYPGCRVDSPSRAYTHILGVDFHASSPFCTRDINEAYFNWVTDTYDIRDLIEFDTEVVSIAWDEATATWLVTAKGPDGERVLRPRVVVTAVGLLSRPSLPTIAGMADFDGTAVHSAWWPEDLDVAGKRVAVIGTGCSGVQMVPELALLAEHVHVFQRTPQWLFDNPGYRTPYPPGVNWLDRNLPLFANFMRFRTNWVLSPYISEPKRLIDPDFDDPHARSAVNKRLRDERLAFIESKLGHDRELIAAMIPPHPPFSTRPIQVDRNFSYYDAVLRDDVDLVTDGIERITPSGVRTVDGTDHDVDVIVYATGFRANECLWPMDVVGRDGRTVEELWEPDGPRAYKGAMLPGFPNLFLVYGPNMNPYGGLGVVNHEEMVTRFVLQAVEPLVFGEARTVDVTDDAYHRYNDALDAREEGKIYRDPRAKSYYQNEHGRSATNCAFTGIEMWHMLRRPDFDDDLVLE